MISRITCIVKTKNGKVCTNPSFLCKNQIPKFPAFTGNGKSVVVTMVF